MKAALLVTLLAACAAPTAGDLRWMSAPAEIASARSGDDAARCIAKALAGAQGFMGTAQNVGMTERAGGGWEITARTVGGVTAHAIVEQADQGARVTVWELGDDQAKRAAMDCR